MLEGQALDMAAEIGAILVARGETLAIAESAAGGLISAALLSVVGASRFYRGGAVLYSRHAVRGLMAPPPGHFKDLRSASVPYVALMADDMRSKLDATWALAESGAAGPDGNAYGDPAGHVVLGLAGPVSLTASHLTGLGDRRVNMAAFAKAGLNLILDGLQRA